MALSDMRSIVSAAKPMERAIALAQQALGTTSPNPAVGAVIVNDGVRSWAAGIPSHRADRTPKSWP